MDADRFDALSRSLTDARSRRVALAALLGGTLGLAGLVELEAKKKRCPPCKKRRKGKCKPKPNGTACSGGSCCGGRCLNTKTDEANCGTCGTVCTATEVCQEGSCFPKAACPATATSVCAADVTACSGPPTRCVCGRSAESTVVCVTNVGIPCVPPSCTSSASCAAGSACVDVTGCCPGVTKLCLPRCPAPVPA